MKASSVLKVLALMSILTQYTTLMAENISKKTTDSQEEDGSGEKKESEKNKKALVAAAGTGFAVAIAVTKKGSKGYGDAEAASE